jgi:hypothetical protein
MHAYATTLDRDGCCVAFLAAAPRVYWSHMSFLHQLAQNAGLFLADFHEPRVALRLCEGVSQRDRIPQPFTQGRHQRLYRQARADGHFRQNFRSSPPRAKWAFCPRENGRVARRLTDGVGCIKNEVDIRYPLRPQPGSHGQEMWEDWLMSYVCGTEGVPFRVLPRPSKNMAINYF